jgi:hypothetical protein
MWLLLLLVALALTALDRLARGPRCVLTLNLMTGDVLRVGDRLCLSFSGEPSRLFVVVACDATSASAVEVFG